MKEKVAKAIRGGQGFRGKETEGCCLRRLEKDGFQGEAALAAGPGGWAEPEGCEVGGGV